MYQTVSYSWDELFEKVWTTPLLQLARQIGVSDVALGKACRKAKIPLPGRGYWAKAPSGRMKPTATDFPKINKEKIHFTVQSIDEIAASVRQKRDEVAKIKVNVPVPEILENPHKLVLQTLRHRKDAQVYEGRLRLDSQSCLCISISPDTFDRSMRIFDALIKASESMGCRWSIADKKTVVSCSGESISVVLKERLTKRLKPKPPEPVRSRRSRWEPNISSNYYPQYEWVSTNDLTFCIDEYVDTAIQRNWSDTKTTKLEEKLSNIAPTFEVVAEALKIRRHRLEEDKRQRQFEEERRKDRRRKAEGQRILRARLVEAMVGWEHSERLRRFCDAAEQALQSQGHANDASMQQWLSWARERAAELDPLKGALAEMATLEVKVPEWFKGLGDYGSPVLDWWTTPKERG